MIDDPNDPVNPEDEPSLVADSEGDDATNDSDVDAGVELPSDVEPGDPVAQGQEPSRATRKVLAEIERRKVLEARLEEQSRQYEAQQRQLAELQQRISQPAHDPEAERRKLEMMDPDQRTEYLINKATQAQELQFRQLKMEMSLSADQSDFRAYIAENPHHKKYKDDVERYFQQALQSGSPRSRQEILSLVIGEEVKKKGPAAVAKARQAGDENIRRQQTKPSSARSGLSGGNQRESESPGALLKRRLAEGAYGR